MTGESTPYSTVVEFFGQKPAWLTDPLDQERIQSYKAYEEIYWNVPDIFLVSLRGSNSLPVYVPSGRIIVESTNRYVCPSFSVSVRDLDGAVTPASQLAQTALDNFMKRESFRAKFAGGKRYNLIKGDWIWHITGEQEKAQGSRISIEALDPGMYFPIYDPEDITSRIGVHLVEETTEEDEAVIRRITYRKTLTGGVTVEEAVYPLDDWRDDKSVPIRVILAPTLMPPTITSIPVYHVKNFEEPGNPFGSSEMRGIERLMGAINQTVSDEDLTLAMQGIGMYATDSSRPKVRDVATGKMIDGGWRIGPGEVIHYDGNRFDYLKGPGGLQGSFGAHYDLMSNALKQSSSTPDIAIGTVDVAVAQSGVALALQLSPITSKAEEKNTLIIDVHNQMFFDLLTMWYPAYESTKFIDITVSCSPGSAIPVDREQRFRELNDMLAAGVISRAFYRSEAAKLGYVFPEDMAAEAEAEYAAANGAVADADEFADRAEGELA